MSDRLSLADALELWRGTPYISGDQRPGLGADCIRLVDGVWESVFGPRPTRLPAHANDTAFHRQDIVQEVLTLMIRRWNLGRIRDGTYRPGDGLIISKNGVEHHSGVVGMDTRVLLHAIPPKAGYTSLEAFSCDGWKIERVYRPLSLAQAAQLAG